MFFSYSSLLIAIASLSKSVLPDNLSTASTSLALAIPNSSITETVSPPLSLTPSKPLSKAIRASSGLDFQAFENSSADIPEILANFSTSSPPEITAVLTFCITLDIEVPPDSALIPSDDIAPAKPNTADSLIPTSLPVPASLKPKLVISDSVVAKLLPTATIAEPMFPNSS